eukprot:m.47124 g.47124  ORF g.47124 m.47124 type:complete len:928 (+) comp10450_c0_seq1:1419-4202(+)
MLTKPPYGGMRVRVRAPLLYAGRMSNVTVSDLPWNNFNAAEETIDFTSSDIPKTFRSGLVSIVAKFAGNKVKLQRATANPRIDWSANINHKYVKKDKKKPNPESVKKPNNPKLKQLNSALVCKEGTLVEHFEINNTEWIACENLNEFDGAILLQSSKGDVEWFSKSYSAYGTNYTDNQYYLGLTKQEVATAGRDVLANLLLYNGTTPLEPTWARVASAAPPLRNSGRGGNWDTDCPGVRTFAGSRSASIDFTFSEVARDCSWNGGPSIQTMCIDLHNKAMGQARQVINQSGIGEGLVGDILPAALFFFPVNVSNSNETRYWTYVNVPNANMAGSREQATWMRFQQIACSSHNNCRLVDWPLYWNSFWFTRFPGKTQQALQTGITGPIHAASASGFYSGLLELKQYWQSVFTTENVMTVELPATKETNGTFLMQQAQHSLVKNMITRADTWHPRYGAEPGYGGDAWNGLQDVFTTTVTAALEWGALPYAQGVIANYFTHYVRDDGMIMHVGVDVPASARVLTVLAMFYSYSNNDNDNNMFMVSVYEKAKALALWLISRRDLSLTVDKTDVRYGIPQGDANPENYVNTMYPNSQPLHFYASATEMYRAFVDVGQVWVDIGTSISNDDMREHGHVLLNTSRLLLSDLQNSMSKTVQHTGNPEYPRIWPLTAEVNDTQGQLLNSYKTYPEMMYSGVLTNQQVLDIVKYMSVGNQSVILLVPGVNTSLSTRAPLGFAYGLLQHDLVPLFLVHFFALSAHGLTRGSWTPPERSDIADRDVPAKPYAVTGTAVVPVYLKWALLYEDVATKTLWIGKAIPRGWLEPTSAAVVATNITSRYGRISYQFNAKLDDSERYCLNANITLPTTIINKKPNKLRIRIRSPMQYLGKMKTVTIAGKQWNHFNATAETIDITSSDIDADFVKSLTNVLACFMP